MKEIKDNTNRWSDIQCSWRGKMNIWKMSILSKQSTDLTQSLTELEQTIFVICISSVQFSRSVVSLWPYELQHARPSCPLPTTRVHPNPCPLSHLMPFKHLVLCHPLLLLPSIFPSIRVFSDESLFTWGGQSIGVSASSVLLMSTQNWSLGWTGWISLQSKGLSWVFSNTTVQKLQFFGAQILTSIHDHWKNHNLD